MKLTLDLTGIDPSDLAAVMRVALYMRVFAPHLSLALLEALDGAARAYIDRLERPGVIVIDAGPQPDDDPERWAGEMLDAMRYLSRVPCNPGLYPILTQLYLRIGQVYSVQTGQQRRFAARMEALVRE